MPRPKSATASPKGRRDSTAGGDTRERSAKRGGKAKSERFEMPPSEPSEPEPTAFEIAWQAALDRQKADKAGKTKKAKPNQQQDEILDRTLKNRLPVG
jgi:hypothetical protein